MDPGADDAVRLRVYRPTVTEGYEWALPVNDSDFEAFRRLPMDESRWFAPEMSLLTQDDRGKAHRSAHMPWLDGHVLILRDEAIEAIGPLLAPHGQVLPLRASGARLAVFSAHPLAGALDEQASELVRFSSGRIMHLRAPVFRPSVVASASAFVLTEMPRGNLYLSGQLVDSIRETGLSSGTEFQLVFDAADPGI